MKRHPGDHNPEDPIRLDDGTLCLGCRLRRDGPPNLGPGATATRTRRGSGTRPMRGSSWEKGIAGEHRADGSFMPYVNSRTLSEIGVKEFGERRVELEAQRTSQIKNPAHYGRLSPARET